MPHSNTGCSSTGSPVAAFESTYSRARIRALPLAPQRGDLQRAARRAQGAPQRCEQRSWGHRVSRPLTGRIINQVLLTQCGVFEL